MRSLQKYLFLVCLFATLVSATQIVRADVVDPLNLPKPIIVPCGGTPCYATGTHVCAKDLVCVAAKNGQNYCATPDRYAACVSNPTTLACCGFVTTQPTSDATATTTTTAPATPAKTDAPQKAN